MNVPRALPALVLISALAACAPRSAAQPGADTAPRVALPGGALQEPTPLQTSYSKTIRFEHIGIAEGLSQSVVNAILQDQRGFLWIGTEDGLNRYNGYEIEIFRPDPTNPRSLSDRWITSLAEDSQGYIWIGTRQGGLNRYDPQTGDFAHYQHESGVRESLADDYVWALLADGTEVWVATANGLDKVETASDVFQHLVVDDGLSSNSISAIHQDKAGLLWIGTLDAGVNRYDPRTRTFTVFQNDPEDPASLSHNRVLSIGEDSNGRIWIGAANGLNRFDAATETFERLQNDPTDTRTLAGIAVLTIYSDRSGGLWIGTENGLDRYDFETGAFIHHQHQVAIANGLSNNIVRVISEDRSGVLWVGTFGGLNKYNRQQDQFGYYQHNPEHNSLGANRVLAMHVDRDGAVWIGTDGSGLDLFSPENEWFSHFTHKPEDSTSLGDDEVWSVLRDRAGIAWVGTGAGLDRYDPELNAFSHFEPDAKVADSLSGAPVYSLAQTRAGVLWVGTARGLDEFDPVTQSFVHHSLEPQQRAGSLGSRVTSIVEDLSGALWIGTFDDGLYLLIRGPQERLLRYSYKPGEPGSLSNNTVLSLALGSSGTLWVGTGGGGLNRFNRASDDFTRFTEQDGLPNDVVNGILEDEDGRLWLSTNYGLSRFDPVAGSFQNFTASDGLQSNEFSEGAYARGPGGELYFGGNNGFNVFRPSELAENPNVPQVALTALTQEGSPLPTAGPVEVVREISLRWPQDSFEFEAAALSFGAPVSNDYAYMLEGYDSDWTYAGTRREGRYADLPGGDYTLLIKASNGEGEQFGPPARLHVSVVPPIWETRWVQGLMVLAAVGVVLGGYRLRTQNIESRNRDLQRLVQLRTSDLEKRTAELEALYGADERILRNVTLSQVFQTLVDVATDLLHAGSSAIFTWDDAQATPKPRVSKGFKPDVLSKFGAEAVRQVLETVVRTGEPVVLVDGARATATVSAAHAADRGGLPEPIGPPSPALQDLGLRSLANFPLKVDGEVIAVFAVSYAQPRVITEDVVRLYSALVQRAALSITNMQLFEQTKELAVIEVRNRLAQDLHDSAKQKAFAALAQLGTASGLLGRNGSEAARTHVAEAENLVHEVIQELTFLIQEIFPLALQEKGLPAAVRDYAFEWESRNDTRVQVSIDGARPLPFQVEQAIYRVVQESLANVARHSKASHAQVCLRYGPDQVELEISDNGVGFDPADRRPGLGLRSIRERVGSLHGTVHVDSTPGSGTKLMVQVPLKGLAA